MLNDIIILYIFFIIIIIIIRAGILIAPVLRSEQQDVSYKRLLLASRVLMGATRVIPAPIMTLFHINKSNFFVYGIIRLRYFRRFINIGVNNKPIDVIQSYMLVIINYFIGSLTFHGTYFIKITTSYGILQYVRLMVVGVDERT